MDLHDETLEGLKGIWIDESKRRDAKIVVYKAIASSTDLTVKECDSIFVELDRLLLQEEGEKITRPDPAR